MDQLRVAAGCTTESWGFILSSVSRPIHVQTPGLRSFLFRLWTEAPVASLCECGFVSAAPEGLWEIRTVIFEFSGHLFSSLIRDSSLFLFLWGLRLLKPCYQDLEHKYSLQQCLNIKNRTYCIPKSKYLSVFVSFSISILISFLAFYFIIWTLEVMFCQKF